MLHDRFLSSSSIEDEDDRTNRKRRKGAVSSQDGVPHLCTTVRGATTSRRALGIVYPKR
jgi:hypothetical protein